MHFLLNMYKPHNSKSSSTFAQSWDPSLALLGHFADRNGRFPTLSTRGLFSRAADASMSVGEKKTPRTEPHAIYLSRWTLSFSIGLHLNQSDQTSPTVIIRTDAWSFQLQTNDTVIILTNFVVEYNLQLCKLTLIVQITKSSAYHFRIRALTG